MVTTSESVGAPVASRPVEEVAASPETVRVTMLVTITGTRDGQDWPAAGEVIEVPADEAAALIRQFNAVPAPEPVAEPEPVVEEAALEPEAAPERATVARRITRRRN